jgi:hypothetical protein
MGESTIVIPAGLMKQLEALPEQEGCPIADIMRDAIRLSIKHHHPDLLQRSLDTAPDASSDG